MFQKLTLAILVTCTFFVSCTQSEQPVSKTEAVNFSETIEKDVRDMKIDFIEKNVIPPAFFKRMYAAGKLKTSPEIENGIKQMLQSNKYEKSVYEMMAGKGNFTRIKQYEKEGKQHIIYRIRGVGFTYIDMELTKVKKQVGIADMFFYGSGEDLSKSMADLAEKIISHRGSEIEKSLVSRFDNINRHIKNTDYGLAKKEFDRLPYNIRNNRLYEFQYLDILSNLDSAEYAAYQKRIEVKYAGNPSIQLMLIDVYINQKEWDKALGSINQVDSVINKDPFLDYYRGLILNMKGDREAAISHYEQLAKADPKFADVYPELVVLHSEQGEREKAGYYFTAYKRLRNADEEMVERIRINYPELE
jgi:tetratricopeptide (TPR) repeat protein